MIEPILERTASDNYHLDFHIALQLNITVDDVDKLPLEVLEVLRDYFFIPEEGEKAMDKWMETQ